MNGETTELWVFDGGAWTYDQGVDKKGLMGSVITQTKVAASEPVNCPSPIFRITKLADGG